VFGISLIRIIAVGFKSLRLHKLRSGLTMLGMIIGVWAVITLVAIGEGASHDAQEAIKALGARNVIIRSVKPLSDKLQIQGMEHEWVATYGLNNADAARIRDTVPGVQRVLPILAQRKNAMHGMRNHDCQLIGTFPAYPAFTQARIVVGRFLNEFEEIHHISSCVITLELAEKLFVGQNPLLQKIVMRGFESAQVFQVVGILQERTDSIKRAQSKDAVGRTTSSNVYIPLSTFKVLYTTKNIDRSPGMLKVERVELSEIRVEFGSVEQVIPSLRRLRDALDTTRKGVIDYEIQVPIDELNTLKAQKARDTRMLMYIACISLLVGGIGIMNIMLATVTERTQEIGIRRALGATRGDITVQFLTETLMLCLIGGCIGVLGGCGFAAFRHHILETTTLVTDWSVLLAFGLSVMVGIVFGMYPARRAANLDPIEALRHS
jgi:putative ABC transport system permease protein